MEHKNSSANSISINYSILSTLAFLVDFGYTNLTAKEKPYKYIGGILHEKVKKVHGGNLIYGHCVSIINIQNLLLYNTYKSCT